MTKAADKTAVFAALKPLLKTYSKSLQVVSDNEANYHLDTHHVMKNKKAMFFGAVQIKKNYVSFHLMPVYVNPALLESMSEALKKRMQGKSCFNFRSIDADLFQELGSLTRSGYEYYLTEGYIRRRESVRNVT